MTGGRPLQLAWFEHEGRNCLHISGWTEAEFRKLSGLAVAELGRRLAILPSEVVESGAQLRSIQPIAGRFEIDQDAVCFVPRFPFLDGISYSLLIDSGDCEISVGSPEVWTIQRPASETASTTSVAAIYPSAGQLPVNLLKLYVHFSGPMSEDWALRAVHIRRADNGEPLDGVFLEMKPELWDRDRRRLTMLLEPGRIKRGLAPNLEAGYPLVEGVAVIVTVDTKFRDSSGRTLRNGAERRYEIGPAVRSRINPADWRCHCPAAGSMDPLTVEFDRPLDCALLEHSLWVNDPAGMALAGRASIGPEEGSWRFEPQSHWDEGRHLVIVDPRLEDLAGNSLNRVFDRDLTRTEDAPADERHVAIAFTCGSRSSLLSTKPTG